MYYVVLGVKSQTKMIIQFLLNIPEIVVGIAEMCNEWIAKVWLSSSIEQGYILSQK